MQVPGRGADDKMLTVGKADVDLARFAGADKTPQPKLVPIMFKVLAAVLCPLRCRGQGGARIGSSAAAALGRLEKSCMHAKVTGPRGRDQPPPGTVQHPAV